LEKEVDLQNDPEKDGQSRTRYEAESGDNLNSAVEEWEKGKQDSRKKIGFIWLRADTRSGRGAF
jgi:hypothetical protein